MFAHRTAALFALTLLATGPCSLVNAQTPTAPAPAAAVTEQEALDIAVEAYTYFYSLITMDVTRRQATNYARVGEVLGRGPANTFVHVREFPPATFRDVVRPNFDTLYSVAWLDLTREPMVLSVPDTGGRYYLMPMLDMWTNVFAVPGKRTTGTGAGRYVVAGPGWSGNVPADAQLIRAPTPYVWVVGRTQTNGVADYPAVRAIQDGYQLQPLSQLGQPPVPVTGTVDPSVDLTTPPLRQVNAMTPAAYFARAAELLKVNPPGPFDEPILARMRRLGIVAGQSFDLASASPIARAALERGAALALQRLTAATHTPAPPINGWLVLREFMGVYGTAYLRRSVVTMVGLGANLPEDAIYPLTFVDNGGQPLNGANRYVLRFPRGQLPPANAFWSLTMYDSEGFQVANPINRFAIGDRDNLRTNPDGSVDLIIQNANPGAELQSNWLPAPTGPFNLTMRLYYPGAAMLDGTWNPPAVQNVTAVPVQHGQ